MSDYIIVENFESFHDTSLAVIKDNKLLSVTETERITKHKHANYENLKDEVIPYVLNQHNITNYTSYGKNELYKFKYKYHHELHALASFLSSGYKKAAILIIDGEGDLNDSITLYYGRDKEIRELKKYNKTTSLGCLYEAASQLIYNASFSEGKTMGLSCCTDPDINIPSPIQFFEDGSTKILYENKDEDIIVNLKNYIRSVFPHLFYSNGKIIPFDTYKAKIAATVQYWFTEQVVNLVKYLKSLSPRAENLCLGGGCFLNCETNGIIDRLGLFDNIYCIPAPADNGLLLGKVQQLLEEPIEINNACLGINYFKSFDELKQLFRITENNESNIDCIYNIQEYSSDWVIERLKQNKVIVWFEGGAEFGPRALSHRSFLGNPATNEMFTRLSIDIKERENYRPLAPVVADNLYPMIFDDPHPENLTQFMLKTVKVKDEWIDKIPAVVHINKTARPQRLTKNVNSELHKLLNDWYNETNIPCLINTSLNLKNQPLLETYSDLLNLICNPKLKGNKVSVVIDHMLCFDII